MTAAVKIGNDLASALDSLAAARARVNDLRTKQIERAENLASLTADAERAKGELRAAAGAVADGQPADVIGARKRLQTTLASIDATTIELEGLGDRISVAESAAHGCEQVAARIAVAICREQATYHEARALTLAKEIAEVLRDRDQLAKLATEQSYIVSGRVGDEPIPRDASPFSRSMEAAMRPLPATDSLEVADLLESK